VLAIDLGGGTAGSNTLLLEGQDDVSGVGEMRLSNKADLADANWEPFALTKNWTFDAQGIVYVQYRDNAGNLSAIMQGKLSEARAPGVYLPKVSR
jgi:hypothetical protein